MRVRTLKQLAKLINDLDNGYTATVSSSWSSTDTKIAGTRMRRQGVGRKGSRLWVRDPKGEIVIDHDTSETYRTVEEAIEKAIELFGDHKLNVDPDEVLAVGTEVVVSDFVTSYGTIEKAVMRGRSKTRVKRYRIKLREVSIEYPSRKIRRL